MKFRSLFAVACVLGLAATPVTAQQPPPAVTPAVKMPTELTVPVGRLTSIVLESNGKVTRFFCPGDGADVFREYDPAEPNKIRLRFIAYAKGTYRLVAYTAIGDLPSEPSICTITVGSPPPAPPVEPVDPVDPTDLIAIAIKAAYELDRKAGKTKPEWTAAIEAVFRQAATDDSTFGDLKFVGQIQKVLMDAIGSKALMPIGSMPATAAAVAKILKDNLPTEGTTPLSAEVRKQAQKLCERLADGLKGVTP